MRERSEHYQSPPETGSNWGEPAHHPLEEEDTSYGFFEGQFDGRNLQRRDNEIDSEWKVLTPGNVNTTRITSA